MPQTTFSQRDIEFEITRGLTVRPLETERHTAVADRWGLSFLQLPEWAQVKAGWEHESLGWFDPDGALVGVALVLYRRVPRVRRALAYLPEGPALPWHEVAHAPRAWLDPLVAHLRSRGTFAVRIGPQVPLREWTAATAKRGLADPAVTRLGDLPPDRTDAVGARLCEALSGAGWEPLGLGDGFTAGQPRYVVQVGLDDVDPPTTWTPAAEITAGVTGPGPTYGDPRHGATHGARHGDATSLGTTAVDPTHVGTTYIGTTNLGTARGETAGVGTAGVGATAGEIAGRKTAGGEGPAGGDAGGGDPRPPQLWRRLNQEWRRNITRAERSGVVVRLGDDADLPAFHALYVETAERDGFTPRPAEYFTGMWRALNARRPRLQLYLAELDGEPLAAATVIRVGNQVWYGYGASSSNRRDVRASNALQWRALLDAHAAGAAVYDLRGVGATLDPDAPLGGLLRFKLGTGGTVRESCGEWELTLSRPWAAAFHAYLKVRS